MLRIDRLNRFSCCLTLALVTSLAGVAPAQIPGLPSAPASKPADKKDPTKGPVSAPTPDNPTATVASTTGPIAVREKVRDPEIERTLAKLLPEYPGVRKVGVAVRDGVVTLNGQVDDDDTLDEVTQFVRRVEGVRLILNRMKTDDEVMTAPELARREIGQIVTFVARRWLLMLIALGVVIACTLAARLFNRYSETILAPLVRNVLLRSVVGSVISGLLLFGGFLGALSILKLTQAVLSILGLAGVVGLAVGFAFKDITENFIASVLLGVRRPFQVGDYVQVAGKAGVVKSLNTRATVLVTLEGQYVRIPNSVIFKEILVNSSASPTARGTFDVVIPYEVSTAEALEGFVRVLKEQDGILDDPAPRAFLQELEPGGVRLRAYYWFPTQGIDGDKLLSDLKLKVKVKMQEAKIAPPPSQVIALSVLGRLPVEMIESEKKAAEVCDVRPVVSADEAKANLRRDSQAAASASPVDSPSHTTAVEHAREQEESRVGDEGENLLETAHAESNGRA